MSTILFLAMMVAALAVFGRTMYRRTAVLLKGAPDDRFDNVGERIQNVLLYAFAQKKFIQQEPRPGTSLSEQTAGWMHFFIFWGFTILAIQVVHMFARGFVEDFYLFPFTPGLLGGPYLLMKDFMEVIVLGCVVYALYRWGVEHPKRLYGYKPAEDRLAGQSHWEAYLILCFIGSIMISGKLYDGGRMVFEADNAHVQAEMYWQPFSYMVGVALGGIGGAGLAELASDAGWWIHNAIILVFLNLLPLSKHFHILTFLPNVFFAKTKPKGQLSKQDLENATSFGTSHINQFTWKQVLDMYSCTECGRCSSHCPATMSGKELAPRQLMLNLRDYLYENEDTVLAAKQNGDASAEEPMLVGENIVGDRLIKDEVLWACTTCRACEEACPIMIEYVDKIVDMRRHLVQEEARFPAELTRTFKSMETTGNPWGIDASDREAWAKGLDIPLMADTPDAEYLYYVGCAGAFDDRNKRTTQAVAKILKAAGVNFAILGKEELCNGETARRIGNEYLFQSMAEMCNEVIQGYNVKKILTNCPHCFNTLKNEFPQFGGDYDVVHATEFVRSLIADGKVELNGNGAATSKRITYHDSCYLGRYNEVFDAPRDILKSVPGLELTEMERSRKFGMCCGAGGGRMWMEEDADKRVNFQRVDQALETKPDAVAVACPFCMTMIDDGLKSKNLEGKVDAVDVMEIVADRLA